MCLIRNEILVPKKKNQEYIMRFFYFTLFYIYLQNKTQHQK